MGNMTSKTVIQVTIDGQLELPIAIRSRLQAGDKFVLWEEEDTIILKRVNKTVLEDPNQTASGNERSQDLSFFAIADRLAELNEVEPISEAEIEAEIRAYKREKREKEKYASRFRYEYSDFWSFLARKAFSGFGINAIGNNYRLHF
jgi:bifunctional DNA-binding transcriptional regulator/antitoxin component of YhaV-PrlF toxin-antitoxin module